MLSDALRQFEVVAAIESTQPSAITDCKYERGELTLYVDPASILDICRFLRDEQAYVRLSTVTALDWHPADPRFEVVYHLHSVEKNERLRLKCRLAEGREIESVTPVWPGANWYERETFDLFGIVFRNHPDLRRIMLPEDWAGHPLRKTYPVHGHRYSYQNE
jgi:NADH-quinone oxidoreductase subunit C